MEPILTAHRRFDGSFRIYASVNEYISENAGGVVHTRTDEVSEDRLHTSFSRSSMQPLTIPVTSALHPSV